MREQLALGLDYFSKAGRGWGGGCDVLLSLDYP